MRDELLRIIANIGNAVADNTDGRSEQGVTLLYGGLLVTGIIVTAQEYFRSHDILGFLNEENRRLPESLRLPADFDHSLFIHLKETKFITAGQHSVAITKGIFWRGRIDRVDGFFLGRVEVEIKRD